LVPPDDLVLRERVVVRRLVVAPPPLSPPPLPPSEAPVVSSSSPAIMSSFSSISIPSFMSLLLSGMLHPSARDRAMPAPARAASRVVDGTHAQNFVRA